ncbi:MAG: metalloprotease [Paracoccaceae bacterium]
MLAFLISLSLCAGTGLILQGGLRGHRGLRIVGLDPGAMGMGLLAILAAGYFWGPMVGAALILAVMVHEFGHVAAYRICGHADARFRLVPLMGGLAISNSLPASQEKQFFISLMGPAIGLAPMVLSLSLFDLANDQAPQAARFLWIFGQVTAVLNFFNLLPLWPLDGSKCLRAILASFWPGAVRPATLLMSGIAFAAAVYLKSLLLIFFCLMTTRSLAQADALLRIQRPMPKGRALLCLACYLATLAAFFMGSGSYVAAFLG